MDDLKLTSVESVKQTAPELVDGMSDDTLNRLISDASITVIADGFPESINQQGKELNIQELATRYLTLHMATMDNKSSQDIASEKLDVIERTYRDKTRRDWLNSSTWGQSYLRMYQMYGGGSASHIMVVQHL